MRSSWKTLVAAAVASLLAIPALATTDEDVQKQLQQMQQRMSQLEDKLQATEDNLETAQSRVEAQHEMLEKAGLDNENSAMSGLSRFLTETEFGGHVAGSYFFNLNSPQPGYGPGGNTGVLGNANIFHPDHNAFSLDQLWFSLANAATAESRAGFEVDLVFGKTADTLRGTGSNTGGSGNGSNPYLFTANVQYLAPVTEAGLLFRFGRFATPVGAESVNTTENFNITRGLLNTTLQPYNHTGLTMGQSWDMGLNWMVGVANTAGYAPFASTGLAGATGCGGGNGAAFAAGTFTQPNAQNYDCDDDKALIWSVGYDVSDSFSATVNGVWGGDNFLTNGGGTNDDASGVVDLVLRWDPSEKLSTWVNFDYLWLNSPGGIPPLAGGFRKTNALGVAAAGRVAITENTGFSLRGEYIRLNKVPLPPGLTGTCGGPGACPLGLSGDPGATSFLFPNSPDNANIFSVTGTLDHSFTENLMVRAEARYEKGSLARNGNQVFYLDDYGPVPTSNHKNYRSNQILLGVEAIYTF